MADPYDPRSLAGPYGMMFRGVDDEEERKRQALLAQSTGQPGNAMESLAGGLGSLGTMAGSPFSKAPPGMDVGLPPSPSLPPSAVTGFATPMRPTAPPNPQSAIEAMLPAKQPVFEGKSLLPGQITDEFTGAHPGYNPARPFASSTDPMERVKQLFLDQQANAPNMGGDASRQLLGGQLGVFNEAMQGQTQRDIAREGNVAKVIDAEARYSPKALAGQSLLTLMGALGGSGRLDPSSIQRALGVHQEVLGGLQPNMGGPPGAAAGAGDGRSKLGDLASVESFLSQQAPYLPKSVQVGTSMDVHGKTIPGMTGANDTFTEGHAGQLLKALSLSKLDDTQKKEAINRLMQTPAGADIKRALIQQSAVDTMAGQDLSQVPKAPSGGVGGFFNDVLNNVRGKRGGEWPGSYTVPGTPFTFQQAPGGRYSRGIDSLKADMTAHGNPYGQVELPGGQTLPFNPGNAFSTYGPGGPSQAQLDQERKQRMAINPLLFEALGLSVR